jgi:hypothetical protein
MTWDDLQETPTPNRARPRPVDYSQKQYSQTPGAIRERARRNDTVAAHLAVMRAFERMIFEQE